MNRILAILFLTNCLNLFSQSNEIIVPFFNNGKWGFMNEKKDIIVCPVYEEAFPSYSNRLRIKMGGKYGYIDQNGKVVVKPKFIEADNFEHGIAKVNLKGTSYYINSKGKKNKVQIPLCGTHKNCFHPKLNDRIKVVEKDGKLGIVHDRMTREDGLSAYLPDTIPPMFDSIVAVSHQLMYLVKDSLIAFSHEGSYYAGADYIVDNLNFEYEQIELFNCRICREGKNEFIGIKKNGLWGYMRVSIKLMKHIMPKYLRIESLASGFALVEYEAGKFGYIDRNGNEYFIR